MWGILVVVLVALLPFLFRWAAGMPVLPGTEPYVIAEFLQRAGLSSSVSVVVVILGAVGLLAAVMLVIPRLLRKTKLLVELSDTIRVMLVLSPAWMTAAALFPSHALILALLALVLVWWKSSRVKAVGALMLLIAVTALCLLLPSSPAGVVEFGALNGYGLFGLILAIAGGAVLWENKARSYFIALGLFALILVSFVLPALVMLGSVAVAVIDALGLVRLWHRRWAYPIVRGPTLLICACGLLFSALVCLSLVSHSGPSAAVSDGLSVVPPGTVLTEMPAEWVVWWSPARATDMPEELRNKIWQSRNIRETRDVLDAWRITSIVITPEMKSRLWNNNDDGLLFLLKQSKTFKKVSQENPVEVWVYSPS